MAITAVILPILAILAAFAINAAHMQLTRTELAIATDASARAAGRAFSEIQSVDSAVDAAIATAALNSVNGDPLRVRGGDSDNEIEFGITTQEGGTNSRYIFNKLATSEVRAGTVAPLAVGRKIRLEGDRPVFEEALEMIESGDVDLLEQSTQPPSPPVVVVVGESFPVVERVAPSLAVVAGVRRHARDEPSPVAPTPTRIGTERALGRFRTKTDHENETDYRTSSYS